MTRIEDAAVRHALGTAPGVHNAALSEGGKRSFANVVLVGGRLYANVMRHIVGLFRDTG